MLVMEPADSIRSLYRRFLSGITGKIPECFLLCLLLCQSRLLEVYECNCFPGIETVPAQLWSQPVFLCIDDTMISKLGTKFENVSNLFNHASHHGSNYLNGHCFVSLILCVSVWLNRKIVYQSVSLGYRMWQKTESKLDLAASMVREVKLELSSGKNVVILCDRWYFVLHLANRSGNRYFLSLS